MACIEGKAPESVNKSFLIHSVFEIQNLECFLKGLKDAPNQIYLPGSKKITQVLLGMPRTHPFPLTGQ